MASIPAHFVVKISWVSDQRPLCEAFALRQLNHANIPNIPTLVYAFVGKRRSLSTSLETSSPPAFTLSDDIINRQLSILVVAVPSPCRQIIASQLSFPQVIEVFRNLITTLDSCQLAGVLHRDISAGNVLVTAEKKVLVNDLDCADISPSPFPPPSPGKRNRRTGTLETAAISELAHGVLPGFVHLPRHDLESVVYLLWKVILGYLWSLPLELREGLLFDTDATAEKIALVRQDMWRYDPVAISSRVVTWLRTAGLASIAGVLQDLRELQFAVLGLGPWALVEGRETKGFQLERYEFIHSSLLRVFDARDWVGGKEEEMLMQEHWVGNA